MYSYNPYYEEYLAHYGVLGMKWGIRRYQPYTKGQKGVFKGLKKDYKKQKKALKAERKYYQAQGDELSVARNKQVSKALKKAFSKTMKEVTEKFNKENWEAYKEKLVRTGSFDEINKIKNELRADQLERATQRISALNNFEDLERSKLAKATKTIDNLAKTTNAVAKMGNAYLAVKDVGRKGFNMENTDRVAKILSTEATATDAAKRAQILNNTRDDRMPNFSGFYKEKANKKDKGNKNNSANNASKNIADNKSERDIYADKFYNSPSFSEYLKDRYK